MPKFKKFDKTEINSIIEQHNKFKGSYFWTPPGNAAMRRDYEDKYSRYPYKFKKNNSVYEITQEVSCTCKNIYYNFNVLVDGSKKDIRALKKLV